jgi:hypothetical protein
MTQHTLDEAGKKCERLESALLESQTAYLALSNSFVAFTAEKNHERDDYLKEVFTLKTALESSLSDVYLIFDFHFACLSDS